ncbi:MAG: hypothetical protein FJ014_06635 [Chloroflexi bacterium]|nr:hypothetical protein [Chloroflexota bacterium]
MNTRPKVEIAKIQWYDEKKKFGAFVPIGKEEEGAVTFYLEAEDKLRLRPGQVVQYTTDQTGNVTSIDPLD